MSPREVVAAPTWLVALAGLIAAVGCSMSVVGAVTTGLFTDEPAHVDRLTEFFDSGRYVIGDELATVPPGRMPDNAYVYGPAVTGLAHEINVLVGNERPGHVERTASAYTVRHLVVAGFGLAGLAATAALGGLLLGSRRWGVVVAGVLAAIPLWTGNAMFNYKDIPVAAGQTLVTLGLVLLTGSGQRVTARRLGLGGTTLAVGVVIMLGTRPGMWVSLAISLTVFAAVSAWAKAFHLRSVAVVTGALIAAYMALVAIYPRVFTHPFVMLWKSAASSADFPLGDEGGGLYQLGQMIQIWPLILLAVLTAGVVVAMLRAVDLLRAHSPAAMAWMLVGAQALALPILIAAHNSRLLNGLRQTLFVVPAQAVLVTVGFAAVLGATRWQHSLLWRLGGGTVIVLGLALPTAVQLSMFPYQYTQLNVAGETLTAHHLGSRFAGDLDYFKTSYRELGPEVSPTVKVICPRWLEPGELARRDESDCRSRQGGTFSAFWRFDGKKSEDRPKTDEFYAIFRGAMSLPPNCHTVHAVTRWQNLKRVTLSRLALCHPGGPAPGH